MIRKEVTLKQVLQPVSLKKHWGRTVREHVRTIPRQLQPTFARFDRCQNQRLCLHGNTLLFLFSFQNKCLVWCQNESQFSTVQIQRAQIRRGTNKNQPDTNKNKPQRCFHEAITRSARSSRTTHHDDPRPLPAAPRQELLTEVNYLPNRPTDEKEPETRRSSARRGLGFPRGHVFTEI